MIGALAMFAPPLLFVVLAWPALSENSAIYDETDHVPAGYVYLTRGDYRLGPDQPPLVKELFALPLLSLHPRVSAEAERAFEVARRDMDAEWVFGDRFLYQDNRPQPLLFRARVVVLLLGALLVLSVHAWVADVVGTTAGLFAATLAALDPNLLAHGSLATVDVGFALFFFAAIMFVRRALRALAPASAIAAAAAIGAAFASKHSALLLVPTVLVLALVRLADPTPWPCLGAKRTVTTWPARAALLLVLAFFWGIASVGVVWAAYGCRWSATPDRASSLPIADWLLQSRELGVVSEQLSSGAPEPDAATAERLAAARSPNALERAIDLSTRQHLLPEGYLYSLAVMSTVTQIRRSYLLGKISRTGWHAYFPFALLVKTPATTLVLAGTAFALLAALLARRRGGARARVVREAVFLIVPPSVFLLGAMSSNLNIGYRHVLPLLPFLYSALGGVPAALAAHFGSRLGRSAGIAALALLAVETVTVRPYFLPFFNVFAGGSRGGLSLLSDSNLDWGQGLPALQRWMAERRVAHVNLSYFGTADPRAYGVAFVPILGSYDLQVAGAGRAGYAARRPELPGYVAVGATNLQGTYLYPDSMSDAYAFLRRKHPTAVLAGSIYVYWVERWGD